MATFDLLFELLNIDSPSGDEGAMADFVDAWVRAHCPDARIVRLGDSLIAIRGERPTTSIYAHIDTTGFTLGYGRQLIPIGSPSPGGGTRVREAGSSSDSVGIVRGHEGDDDGDDDDEDEDDEDGDDWELTGVDGVPGSRWVYAAKPRLDVGEAPRSRIVSPYLDNRAGVWAALQVLQRCPSVAVAFTTGEEHSGQGAYVCGRYLFETLGITRALISDITWHTEHVHCGKGVAISLRDRMVPRQRFLDRVLSIAASSGIQYQREIESSGGSDGGYLQRSGFPIDWVFVGAPEKDPHSDHETVHTDDLEGMAGMLAVLVENLS